MRNWMIGSLILLVFSFPYSSSENRLTIGSKKFTESVVLGEILRLVADSQEGEAVHFRELGGTTLVFQALVNGEVDVYPEYTGTIREEILNLDHIPSDQEMATMLADQGIKISRPLGFNNTYAIGMLQSQAQRLGIDKLSDLQRFPDLVFGFSNEFLQRQDGWPGLRQRYDFPQRNVTGMDQDLAYRQLLVSAIDCMDVYSTDAKIEQNQIIVLEDDLQYFPRYDAVLLYRKDLEQEQNDIVSAWLQLEGEIDEQTMMRLNAEVELSGNAESEVAASFLSNWFSIETTESKPNGVKRLWATTFQHIDLVRRSLFPAILCAIPLGIAAAKVRFVGKVIIATVSIFQTIPSLALLVMLIPVMAFMGFRSVGLGSSSAIIALFLYSLLPIVRNTHSGLTEIRKEHSDAARGLGLTAWQRLFAIELPLSAGSILAGIKTAAVMNVGFATLGALIGAGGYGQPILSGIRLNSTSLILEGAVPAAALALLVQYGFELVERVVVSRGLRV